MAEKENDKIELRSEEVQEILGHVPAWIIRWGILVILITVLLIIFGSWLFKYPDIKRANILITTENPPATLVARATGKIVQLFVQDNQYVETHTVLAVIENPADYGDVLWLDEVLDEIRDILPDFNILVNLNLNTDYLLGEIQPAYASFIKVHKDYQNFIELNYHAQKIMSLNSELDKLESHLTSLRQIRNILKGELELVSIQFERDSNLLISGVNAPADYEKSKANLLRKQYEYEQARINESDTEIQIVKLNQDILDLELRAAEEKRQQQNAWQISFDNVVTGLSLWKQKYILEAPIDGIVSFTAYWSVNQNVREGDRVMTVIPSEQGKILGKISLSIEGAGKVEEGQQVNIRIDNFPYLQYGMVKGIVRNISLIPDDREYIVEVDLPEGLTTYYGIDIPFKQEMQGTAQILTDKRRLLERIVAPIKDIISEQKAHS
ncbi:MAG: hypothetical protein AMS27_10890 [Bacteroides sp. SM23_62_1]|nr:MAG: hypothetical protein AMS27_10890 [Bacteroides sp. SM23_62_1]